jgi:hypothetical protein
VVGHHIIKLKELGLGAAPAALVGSIVGVKVGLVPDFPILYVIVKAVGPALGIVADNMLADYRPFFKVLWGQGAQLGNGMLYSGGKMIVYLGAYRVDNLKIMVGIGKYVGCRVLGVGIEITEYTMHVYTEFSAVGIGGAGVVQTGIGVTYRFIVVYIGDAKVRLPFIYGAVVNRMHRLYFALGF